MEKLRIAVIGLGWFGEIHCDAISAVPELQLAGLCTRTPSRLKALGHKYNVSALYTDYNELLEDSTIDAVSIATQWEEHAEPALAALAAGKHVLLEKPMASTVADCIRLCEAAKSASGALMVGHVCRFNPRFMAAKREIETGKIGTIVSLSARRNMPAIWTSETLNKIGPISSNIVHDIDMMLWLAAAKVVRVYAQTVSVRGLKNPDIGQVMLKFDTGATATLESVTCMPENTPFDIDERMEVIGTDGLVHVQDTFPNISIVSKDGFASPDTTYWPTLHAKMRGALPDEFAYFAQCIIEKREPNIITPEEAMEATRVALAAEQSAVSGNVVLLE